MATQANGKVAPPKTCFIAMPISTRPSEGVIYEDDDHWTHVMESLFVKAVEAAGYEAITPAASGAHLIHGLIIGQLSAADLVLCDLSSHNPNVFFELGVRTALNLPIALVRDELTELPFDTSAINTHRYQSSLRPWTIERELAALTAHIIASAESCRGTNPLWRQFGLTVRAEEPETTASPLEAKVDLLTDRMLRMQETIEQERVADPVQWAIANGLIQQNISEPSLGGSRARTASGQFADEAKRYADAKNATYLVRPVGTRRAVVYSDTPISSSEFGYLQFLAAKYDVIIEFKSTESAPSLATVRDAAVKARNGPPPEGDGPSSSSTR